MFLERLKQSDIYDNSIIVVASDHSEPVDDDSRGRPSISKNGNECVFIVINAAKGKFIQGPIGQIDVYPTVLDVIGLNSYRWKGLGHSLLRYDIHSVAESNDETTGEENKPFQKNKLLIILSCILVMFSVVLFLIYQRSKYSKNAS